ncbi:MAG TPA: class I SAM-dependent methyltransferase [Rhodospirillaceae bacterium]|nr:class I SAM-dependent methyltransferase [Rhodospirillaceae bacterium]
MTGELGRLIYQQIQAQGPLSVEEYMALCLGHPEWGYYTSRDPFGAAGDFVTAPEISQMFGELIGFWACAVWQSMGAPPRLVLAELGPGRGTLMADALRAAAVVPEFRQAIEVILVETSPTLRRCQRDSLAAIEVTWLDQVMDLPDGPLLLIANEFFDALPIAQFVLRADGWRQRRVGLAGDELGFVDGPILALDAPPAAPGDIFEINPQGRQIASWIGRRLCDQGGAALIIDYGHPFTAIGDTLQAVFRHQPVSVFQEPGAVDLTAHLDFQALADAARPAQATTVVTQGAFLRALGIEIRADRLMKSAPKHANSVASACQRLIEPAGMGNLFKVMGMTHPGLPLPPGFPS